MSGAGESCEVGNPGTLRDDTAGADDRFSAAPPALGSSSDFPALPGWADVWRSALRALHLQRSLPCHFSLDLPQASQLRRDDKKERVVVRRGPLLKDRVVVAREISDRPLLQQLPSRYNDPLLFVIPSSRGICSSTDPSWVCFCYRGFAPPLRIELSCLFTLDRDLDVGSHFTMQLDRHMELTQLPKRLF